MIPPKAILGLAIALGLLLAGAPRPAGASHTIYMVDDPGNNPNGTITGYLWGVNTEWVINGNSLLVCSDWGPNYTDIPAGVRQALSDWEAVLPGTQFNQGCGSGRSTLWFKLRSSNGAGYNCGADARGVEFAGCTLPTPDFIPDVARGAFYPGDTTIWINDTTYAFTDNGWRALAAHELGHVFGLDEAYIEDGGLCNGAVSSVMDAGTFAGSTMTGPCPGDSVSPTQRDIDAVQSFYQLSAPSQLVTSLPSSGVMSLEFWDGEWAESGYQFSAYRWTGSYWGYTGETWLHTYDVGFKDEWNTAYYVKGSGQTDGFYQVCASAYSGIYGNQGLVCSNVQYLAVHDDVMKYITVLGPAIIPISDTVGRNMFIIGEMGNLSGHVDTVSLGLGLSPGVPLGCTRVDQLILPGDYHVAMLFGEQRYYVYRVHYKCHAPAVPQVITQTNTVSLTHIDTWTGGEDATQTANDSKTTNKQVIID